jgi:hypothetical protein
MTSFIASLAAYHLRDAAASLRPMTAGEVALCTARDAEVKAHFHDAPETPQPEDYPRFKAWEAANARIVALPKQDAARRCVAAGPAREGRAAGRRA